MVIARVETHQGFGDKVVTGQRQARLVTTDAGAAGEAVDGPGGDAEGGKGGGGEGTS